MSGSYIDPCESGAYQGSGSEGAIGSWNGSGSGNDSITSENCCQTRQGAACCVPGRLKMRLYQITHYSYIETEGAETGPMRWGEVEDSRIYTLVKTSFCSENGSSYEKWVIEDPDSNFGTWGDLSGAYFDFGGDFSYRYKLVLPNSPVKSIRNLFIQCKCLPQFAIRNPVFVPPIPKCEGCFLARSRESGSSDYLLASDWAEDFGKGIRPSDQVHSHQVMVWGESVDLEKCYGITDSPPKYLHTQYQIPTSNCHGNTKNGPDTYAVSCDFKNKAFLAAGVPTSITWRRIAYCIQPYIYGYAAEVQNEPKWLLLPPFYHYKECGFPFKKGSPGASEYVIDWLSDKSVGYNLLVQGRYAQNTRFLIYDLGLIATIASGTTFGEMITGHVDNCTDYSKGTIRDYMPWNSWRCQISPSWGAYIGEPHYPLTANTFKHTTSTNCTQVYWNAYLKGGGCLNAPKSVAPVYDILYFFDAYFWENSISLPAGINYTDIPCEDRIKYMVLKNCSTTDSPLSLVKCARLVLTEAPVCVIAPPTPPPLPPPASGSTPSPIGSEPGSGSSGSGSSGSSAPIVCAGNCEYQIYYRELNQDLTWTLMYRLWNNDCRLSCRCDGEQEITVTYVGEPYQWPNELFFPCVATTPGSTPGSTSEE